jgi:ATP-dependent Clp protease, protease subunit
MSELMPPVALEGGFDPRSAVFDRLLKNRVVMLGSDVNDDIANQICAQLLYLEGEDPARTSGCTSTARVARSPPAWRSTTRCSSSAATSPRSVSASPRRWGSSCSPRAQRASATSLPNARIMMHQPLAGLRGQASDIAIQAEQLRYTKLRMATLIAEHSGQTLEQIQADSERDRWFTAEEGRDYGLVDKVILRRGEIN